MSYTIGIKRRFGFGFKKYQVNGHDWQNFRFILDLIDGSQIYIPGFSAVALRVYPNFWTHIAQLKQRAAVEDPKKAEPPAEAPISVQAPEPQKKAPPSAQPEDPEVLRRAHERLRSIYAGSESASGFPS